LFFLCIASGVARQNGTRGETKTQARRSLIGSKLSKFLPVDFAFILVKVAFCGNFGYLFIFLYLVPKKHHYGAPETGARRGLHAPPPRFATEDFKR